MRTDDLIHAVNWLSSHSDVDSSAITGYGVGPVRCGAAPRRSPRLAHREGGSREYVGCYLLIVNESVHRNSPEVAIPGILRKYEISDLVLALAPRPVEFINRVDAMGNRLRESMFQEIFVYVFNSDRNLGDPDRVRLRWRRRGAPSPID